MASEIRTVGKHSLVYGLGIVMGKLASFLMLPIYTRYLTPVDYGVLELLAMTIDIVGMIAGLGFVAGLYKYYSEAEGPEQKSAVMGTAAVGSLLLAAAGAALGLAFASPLSRLVLGANGSPTYVRLFFLIYVFQTFSAVPLALMRAENRSVLFVSVNTAKLVMSLSLNILTVVHLDMGVLGVMISSLATEGAMALVLGGYQLRRVGMKFSRHYFSVMLAFGRPMVLWSLGTFVLVFSDRFFVQRFSGTGQVGIYSLSYQFAFVLSGLAFTPFMSVWDPRRFEIAKRPDAQDIYSRVFLYLNIVVGLAGAGVALFVHDFLRIMSAREFWPAAAVVPLLLVAQIVFMWSGFCNTGLFLTGQSKVMGRIAVWMTAATLALNFAFIPFLGMWGAAIATLIAYVMRFVMIYKASQKAYHIAYDWNTVVKFYAVVIAAVALRLAGWSAPLALSIPLSVLLFAATAQIAYGRILQPWERAAIMETVHQAWSRVRLEAARARRLRLADRA